VLYSPSTPYASAEEILRTGAGWLGQAAAGHAEGLRTFGGGLPIASLEEIGNPLSAYSCALPATSMGAGKSVGLLYGRQGYPTADFEHLEKKDLHLSFGFGK